MSVQGIIIDPKEIEDLSDEELAWKVRDFVKALNSLLTVATVKGLSIDMVLARLPADDGLIYRTVHVQKITKLI